MKHPSKQGLMIIVLLAAIIACSYPLEQVAPHSDVQTAAALTVQAIMTLPLDTPTIEQGLIPTTPSATSTATPASPTATITPTYSVPMLTVREQTNCRTGPGQDYEIIFTYLAGKKLEIVGRYDPGNFWLVKSAESPTGTCWLWGEYTDVTGSYWVVSSVTPPATATKRPPQAPSIQKYDYFCNSPANEMTVAINWTDKTDDETGYRVYRDKVVIAELPANSTTFVETTQLLAGQSAEYQIEVYNATGSAGSSLIKITCE